MSTGCRHTQAEEPQYRSTRAIAAMTRSSACGGGHKSSSLDEVASAVVPSSAGVKSCRCILLTSASSPRGELFPVVGSQANTGW